MRAYNPAFEALESFSNITIAAGVPLALGPSRAITQSLKPGKYFLKYLCSYIKTRNSVAKK